jgi:hypothetical protein
MPPHFSKVKALSEADIYQIAPNLKLYIPLDNKHINIS